MQSKREPLALSQTDRDDEFSAMIQSNNQNSVGVALSFGYVPKAQHLAEAISALVAIEDKDLRPAYRDVLRRGTTREGAEDVLKLVAWSMVDHGYEGVVLMYRNDSRDVRVQAVLEQALDVSGEKLVRASGADLALRRPAAAAAAGQH